MKGILYFLGGAGVGAGVSYFVCRYLFKKKLEQEVKSYAKAADIYKKKQETKEASSVEEKPVVCQNDIHEAKSNSVNEELNKVTEHLDKAAKQAAESKDYQHIIKQITLEEASQIEWPEVEYSIYEDGVLTDKHENVVTSPESLFGPDYENLFRNPNRTTYYFSSDILKKLIIVYKVNEPYNDTSDYEQLSYYYENDEEEDYD